MQHFTIDTENNITVHANRRAARDTGASVFSTEVQFADLIGPDNKRLLEIYNSLPGVKPVTKFANRKAATERIWKAIQTLGEVAASKPEPAPVEAYITELAPQTIEAAIPAEFQPEPPAPETTAVREPVSPSPESVSVANTGGQGASVAPEPACSKKAARQQKGTPKSQESAQPEKGESKVANERTNKKAEVIAMMKRAKGATLAEIMEATGWQKHTVHGFVSILGSKAGETIESSKNAAGERTYRIAK